jgi:hypothetical protein
MDFMDGNRITRGRHPPYSPDLAPSDFFLFGDVKRQLSGCSFDHADDLLTAVREILDAFGARTLIRVSEEWVMRLEQCIETKDCIWVHSEWIGQCGDANGCLGHPIGVTVIAGGGHFVESEAQPTAVLATEL